MFLVVWIGVEYLGRALDRNWIPAQLASAEIFRRGHVIETNLPQSAHWFTPAAD
jgi:TPR repeat protein